MPSKPAYTWPIPLAFDVRGRKPCPARLPGLRFGPCGRFPGGARCWRCYLHGLLAN